MHFWLNHLRWLVFQIFFIDELWVEFIPQGLPFLFKKSSVFDWSRVNLQESHARWDSFQVQVFVIANLNAFEVWCLLVCQSVFFLHKLHWHVVKSEILQ